jgi:hypothetical protein
MKLLTITVATAAVLIFALSPRLLAQGSDDGAVGRPLQLDGGPSLGSDNRGQTGARSQTIEPSAGTTSRKSQTTIEQTGETAIRGRSKTHIGWRSRPRHRFAIYRRPRHVFAFRMPRHRFVIHRHGHRFVAFNDAGI